MKTFLKKSIAGELSISEQEQFLRSKKDISSTELASAVKFLMKQMPKKANFPGAIDICGTGGSGLSRINTSTISAFILADLGVKVAKHGNKAASGRFGSFDLLEKLGAEARDNLLFLYAREFHPVMKHFAQVRTKIGKPTFFNLLGPLLNPANTKRQIIGTAFKDKMQLIAETCKLIGKEKVYVVCGEDGLDEVTLTGKTFVTELNNGKIKNYTISPEDFGVEPAKFDEIKGGDSDFNVKIALDILDGKCKSRHLDLVLINCALALKLCGKVKSLEEGYLKPSDRDFYKALKAGRTSIIAEVKKRSPSKGMICKTGFSPAKIAKNYEKQGADAISVLCDKKRFSGNYKYMLQARENTDFTPILCKDFITSAHQILKARRHGADAVLLIASDLSEKEIKKLYRVAKRLNMDVLCEVHTLKELKKVLKTPAKIIGINNRDLRTFKIDLNTTREIAPHIPKNKVVVSESGMFSRKDIPKNVDAVLVGTALMQGTPLTHLVTPKLKICGIKTIKAAKFCEDAGVDFIGLNFVPSSFRKISFEKAKKICEKVRYIKKVGVFQDQKLSEINKLAKHLDFIQLCGNEEVEFIKKCKKPVIKTIAVGKLSDLKKAYKYLPHVASILLDGPKPGSGISFDFNLLKNIKYPFFIAGGINLINLDSALKLNPLTVDIASGVETDSRIDPRKIHLILNQLKSC